MNHGMTQFSTRLPGDCGGNRIGIRTRREILAGRELSVYGERLSRTVANTGNSIGADSVAPVGRPPGVRIQGIGEQGSGRTGHLAGAYRSTGRRSCLKADVVG